MTTSSISHHEAFTIGRTIGDTVRVLFGNLPQLLLLNILPVLIVGGAFMVLFGGVMLDPMTTQPENLRSMFFGFSGVFAGIVVLVVVAVVYGITFAGTVQFLVTGSFGLWAATRLTMTRLVPLLVASLLVALAIMAGPVVAMLVGAVVGQNIGIVTALLPLAGLVLAVIMAMRYWVTLVVVVFERRGPLASMARSAALTRGRRGRLFATVIVAMLCVILIAFLVQGIIIGVFGGGGAPSVAAAIIGMLFGLAVNVMMNSCWSVLPAVAYYWLRHEKEGPEAETLAAVFG